MGSPRLQQDELTGGFIIAPGSDTKAAVQQPLADIAGGKSGTDAHIDKPYNQSPLSNEARQASGQQTADTHQQRQQESQQQQSAGDQDVTQSGKDKEGEEEYSEQQQSQQASGACKQS